MKRLKPSGSTVQDQKPEYPKPTTLYTSQGTEEEEEARILDHSFYTYNKTILSILKNHSFGAQRLYEMVWYDDSFSRKNINRGLITMARDYYYL